MSTTSNMPKTMKAWQFTGTSGGMERNMSINTSAPLPPSASSLGANDSLVKVLAMSINPVDYKIAELPIAGRIIARPASPGLDFCGRIVSTGSGISGQLKPGQLVFGRLDQPKQFGTCAEYTVAPRAGTNALPDGISPRDAASLGTAALTAYQCIVPNVKAGDRVFINGGSGGTGVYGIQIAKTVGCHVTTSCSTPNVALCKELGADEVLDYKTVDVVAKLKESGHQFGVIVDNVGNPAMYSQSHHFLKPEGKYVQVGAEASLGGAAGLAKSMLLPGFLGGGKRKFEMIGVKSKASDFEQMAQWLQDRKIKAVVEKTYAFEDAVKAYEHSKSGRTKGKVVINVSEA